MTRSPLYNNKCGLLRLPNEILLQILGPLPTRTLLPLTLISALIHDLILRILHHRLSLAASHPHHELILECYHPASKWTEPYLMCQYLGTPGLSVDGPRGETHSGGRDTSHGAVHGKGSAGDAGGASPSAGQDPADRTSKPSRLGQLSGLYSRFRPHRREDARRPIARMHPAGGSLPVREAPGTLPVDEREGEQIPVAGGREEQMRDREPRDGDTADGTGEPRQARKEHGRPVLVAHLVSLDPEDMFSQLCVVTNLVKLGPRSGVFTNLVNVSDGLVRIGRQWLLERGKAAGGVGRGGGDGDDRCEDVVAGGEEAEDSRSRTLWLDNRTDIGLVVRIREKKWKRAAPVLLYRDEEPAVTYSMEYEELLVKTTHLLFAMEESLQQEQNKEGGKAMVFGAFVER